MKKDNEVSLKEALNNMLDSYKLKSKLRTLDLQRSWDDVVGPMIAKHTKELYLKKDVLIVKFDSAPLKHEMMMMRSKLKHKLNEALGEQLIKEILVL